MWFKDNELGPPLHRWPKNFCLCLPTNTGIKIMGFIEIIQSLSFLIFGIYLNSQKDEIRHEQSYFSLLTTIFTIIALP